MLPLSVIYRDFQANTLGAGKTDANEKFHIPIWLMGDRRICSAKMIYFS